MCWSCWSLPSTSNTDRRKTNYPTTTLADVYGVIAYYLRHQAEMDTYIAEYEREGDQLRRKIEAEHGPFLKNCAAELLNERRR